MINIVSSRNLCLIGRSEEVFDMIKALSLKYGTVREAILDLQKD